MHRLKRREGGGGDVELKRRDWDVLTSVADFRFMSGRQIERLHFAVGGATNETTARVARRALDRLTRQRVLARLHRRVGGIRAGSASYTYRVGQNGRRLLQGQRRMPRGDEPSLNFLSHCLAIADVFITVATKAAEHRYVVTDYQTEPRCWRRLPGIEAAETLRPDLYVVTTRGDTEWHWFIEVDRGTEHGPVIRGKCRQYQRYYQAGIEQARNGVFPRVAWLTTSPERVQQIDRVITSTNDLEPKLFVVGLLTDIVTTLAPEGRP